MLSCLHPGIKPFSLFKQTKTEQKTEHKKEKTNVTPKERKINAQSMESLPLQIPARKTLRFLFFPPHPHTSPPALSSSKWGYGHPSNLRIPKEGWDRFCGLVVINSRARRLVGTLTFGLVYWKYGGNLTRHVGTVYGDVGPQLDTCSFLMSTDCNPTFIFNSIKARRRWSGHGWR